MNQAKSKTDLSGTHIPVLVKLLQYTDGAVLELGAGYNSTPLFYWYCKVNGRVFVSYENDKEWCKKMGNFTKYVEDWDKVSLTDRYWHIAFLDHRPAIRRKDDAERLKNNALFVVLHDSEPEINRFYRYTWIYKHFKYRYDYTKLKPNTVILSNFIDPEEVFSS